MVRTALSRGHVFAIAAASTLAVWTATAGAGELSGAAAIADAVLWGKEMPASALTADLPRNVQSQLNDYFQRERTFRSDGLRRVLKKA